MDKNTITKTGKKYLVTGTTGHLCPHLINILLNKGHEVYALHRRTNGGEMEIVDVLGPDNIEKVNFIYGDFTNFNDLDKIFKSFKFNGVYHLGAQSSPSVAVKEPLLTMHINVIGTANIIQAITENQPECKLLFVSTSEVYGNSINEGEKIKEDAPLHGANPYSASKIASDIYLQERIENGKINAVITRAFSHLSSRRGRNFSISSDAYQIAAMMVGKQEKVLKIGNLDTIRVVIDGKDVAMAYYMLMEHPDSTGIYNVCGDTPHKMRYYTDLLIEASGLKDVKREIYKPYWRDIEIQYQMGDSTKIKELTGWKPTIPIEQTMSDVLNYWVKKLS